MPLAKTYGGNAASPVIFDDRVILYRGTYRDHFLLAVDKRTGRELWRVPLREKINAEMACSACPIRAGDLVILHSARSVQAFDLASGERRWLTKCATTATSTPVLAGEEVIVAAWNKMGEPDLRPEFPTFEAMVKEHDGDGDGTISRDEMPTLWIFHRPLGIEAPQNGATVSFAHADRSRDGEITADEWTRTVQDLEGYRARYATHGILAVRIDSDGLVEDDQIRTLETRSIPEVPSPLCDGEHVYLVKNGGVLTTLELASGERTHRMRTGGSGTHYASPLIAGGRLYTIAGNGRITVLTTGPRPEVLAQSEMGDRVFATPAIVGGTIYVRTHSALHAFGEAAE